MNKALTTDNTTAGLLIGFFLFLLLFTQSSITMTNPASRFLTIESLVENGDFSITEKHRATDDKFFRNGEYYSSKAPLLSVMGAAVYYPLRKLGFNLPENDFLAPNFAVYSITLALVGGSAWLLLYFFLKFLKLAGAKSRTRLLLGLGLAAGTLYLPFSTTLNNHTIAGSLLFISFYFLFKMKNSGQPQAGYFAASGFTASLAAAIELPAGLLFLALFAAYILWSFPKRYLAYYFLGALPPLMAHLYLNYRLVGDLLPPQFHPELGAAMPDRNLSVWQGLGGSGPVNSLHPLLYIFNILFGTYGWFLYSPLLLVPAYGAYRAIKDKNPLFKKEAVIVLSGLAVLIAFYTIKVRIYTESSFGFRWLIAATPLLYLFAACLFQGQSEKYRAKFTALLLLSVFISLLGLVRPWPDPRVRITYPWLEESKIVEFPLLANIIYIQEELKQ